jgi:hypothetical protein
MHATDAVGERQLYREMPDKDQSDPKESTFRAEQSLATELREAERAAQLRRQAEELRATQPQTSRSNAPESRQTRFDSADDEKTRCRVALNCRKIHSEDKKLSLTARIAAFRCH